jgi:hypothetical protein
MRARKFQTAAPLEVSETEVSVVLPARDQTVTDDYKQMTDEQRRRADDLNRD